MLRPTANGFVLLTLLAFSGCATLHSHEFEATTALPPAHGSMPRELSKTVLPAHTVEPPDILTIAALQLIPKAPYRLRTGDHVLLEVEGVNALFPIRGRFVLQMGGVIDLGPAYGSLSLGGLTVDEARIAIEQYLSREWTAPMVSLSLLEIAGLQQIAGQHLVQPDGTVSLGSYGTVTVVGMTIPQVRAAIESHLSQYLDEAEIAVEMYAFNSKVYYIVTEGAGLGDQVVRVPVMGGETLLDAMANMGGMNSLSSKHIWIARPSPYSNEVQILPVDWVAITKQGATDTNYQIMPGDRIFVAENELVALDTRLGKLFAPFERIMGFSTLSLGTVSRFSGSVLGGGRRGGAIVFPP